MHGQYPERKLNLRKTSRVPDKPRFPWTRLAIERSSNVTRAFKLPLPPWHRTMTAVAPPSPPCLRSTVAVQSRKIRLTTLRRSRGVSTAVMAVLPRCNHLTGPAVLPPTPQLCRQRSPWHRHQTAVVTQWDRHVRCHTAVVTVVAPPLRCDGV